MENRKNKIKKMSDRGWKKICVRCLAFFFVVLTVWTTSDLPVLMAEEEKAQGQETLPQEIGELYAKSAVLMDADSGRVLVAKDGDTMRPMASTTKIMTCILALEKGNPEDIVTASGEAASQPKVHLGMVQGEQFLLKDLLHSLMLESHNDSAVAIAEHIGGSVPEFAAMMNEKAKEIGCTNAHFVTPNGLDSSDEGGVHSISAADLARIMSYCVSRSPKSQEFLEITQTSSYSFSDKEGKRSFSCSNHNLFLSMMEGAISGKTGFTGDAGYCYVGALRRGERTFTVALLACGWPNNKSYKWADTKKLMTYGLEHYEYKDVWREPELKKIEVIDGIPESGGLAGKAKTGVRLDTEEKSLSLLLGDMENVEMKVTQETSLKAPVKKGQIVGAVSYSLNGSQLKEYPIVTVSQVKEKTPAWYVGQVIKCWLDFSACNAILK